MRRQKNKETAVSCINPATGKEIAQYPYHTADDVHNMVKNARLAQKSWADEPLQTRIRYILRVRDYIMDNADHIAEIISLDNGKTLMDAMTTEVVPSVMAASYYCKNAKKFLQPQRLAMGNILFINKMSRLQRLPYGVIGVIAPWNYPFSIPFSEIVMALLSGNTVLAKVASETPMVGEVMKQCFEAADMPSHVYNYVNTPPEATGDAFLDAGVDKLFFTGSVRVGKYLMQQAAKYLIPVVLELGGKDPMIVCQDADLERAASGAVWAGLQNAGQTCGGVERIYVQKTVYHDFLELVKEKVESLKTGDGQDFNVDVGAMTLDRQIKTVNTHVDDAIKKGAVVFAKSSLSENLKGQFMPCTILSDVNHDMLVMQEETFGPVLGVMPFDDISQAIDLANDSDLGLTASVWSRNRRKAMDIASRIHAGTIMINDHLMSHGLAEVPWGGVKHSSIGRTHGEIGFSEMTQPQAIVNDIMPGVRRNFWWHPYNERLYHGVKNVMTALYSKNLVTRVKGLAKLLDVFFLTFKKKVSRE